MKQQKPAFFVPERGELLEKVSTYAHSASWPQADTCFNVADFNYPLPHTHNYYEILCILSGSVVHTINGSSYPMYKGDCCLIRPNDRHCFDFQDEEDEATLHINFMIQSAYMEHVLDAYSPQLLPSILGSSLLPPFSLTVEALSEIQRTCLQIQTPSRDPSFAEEIICKSVVNRLLGEYIHSYYAQAKNNYPLWLQNFVLQLNNPTFFRENTNDLLSSIPYSYSYIQRQFKEYLGSSIITYRNSVKMAAAKRLLGSTRMSVQEIAFYLGFDSVAHLNHLFKKQFGITPLASRKQQRNQ